MIRISASYPAFADMRFGTRCPIHSRNGWMGRTGTTERHAALLHAGAIGLGSSNFRGPVRLWYDRRRSRRRSRPTSGQEPRPRTSAQNDAYHERARLVKPDGHVTSSEKALAVLPSGSPSRFVPWGAASTPCQQIWRFCSASRRRSSRRHFARPPCDRRIARHRVSSSRTIPPSDRRDGGQPHRKVVCFV